MQQLKLSIELVPSTSWYNNLRKVVTKEEWNKIRRKSYKDAGHKCAICGAKGKLNCHEVWSYNDETHVQKLEGFTALCDLCHHVKHIGLSGILAMKGELDMEEVIEHFMKVNSSDRKTFESHRNAAFKEWEERSTHDWQVDLGRYENVVKKDILQHEKKLSYFNVARKT